MFDNIQKICIETFYWPCTQAYRYLTSIVTSLKTVHDIRQRYVVKYNYMWFNHNETG